MSCCCWWWWLWLWWQTGYRLIGAPQLIQVDHSPSFFCIQRFLDASEHGLQAANGRNTFDLHPGRRWHDRLALCFQMAAQVLARVQIATPPTNTGHWSLRVQLLLMLMLLMLLRLFRKYLLLPCFGSGVRQSMRNLIRLGIRLAL